MMILGHKTLIMSDHYDIMDQEDLRDAIKKLAVSFDQQQPTPPFMEPEKHEQVEESGSGWWSDPQFSEKEIGKRNSGCLIN